MFALLYGVTQRCLIYVTIICGVFPPFLLKTFLEYLPRLATKIFQHLHWADFIARGWESVYDDVAGGDCKLKANPQQI